MQCDQLLGIADPPPNLLFVISHFHNWQYAIAVLVIDFLLVRSHQICYDVRNKSGVKKTIFKVKYVDI